MWAGVQESFPIQSLSTLALIYCFVVMVAAYMARGASGFGAAVAMPLLGLVVPLKILVPAWTLVGIAAGVALLGEDRKNVSWREMAKLVPGCLVGIAVGLYVFTLLTSETLAKWLGVMVLLYGLYSLVGTFRADVKPKLPSAVAAAFGGFGGGITGTVVGTMGSVFFAMYFDAIRLAKEQYRATMTAILLTLTVVRGAGYWAVGEFSREVLIAAAMLFVPMLIGIFIGNRFHHGMSDLTFRRTVSGALIASGVALLMM
ncbi:MAG: sulfite exporter TauE/SafE family protein [Xanthobacteraceae bacterium]